MKYVEAGGVKLSVIGLGTWQFGSGEWAYGQRYATSVAPEIVSRSLDLGVNLIDTAEIYGFGRSEEIVGRSIAERRRDVFLATKLFPLAPFDPVLKSRVSGSMKRLGVDDVDLYQLHWHNPVVPLKMTLDALGRLREKGHVRNIGVSNFSLPLWEEAERVAKGPVISNQVRYSLADRSIEPEMIRWAQDHDRIVIAYSPLGQGLLSGRYDAANVPKGMRASAPAFLPENLKKATPLIETLREIARAHDASCSQVALAWVVRHPNVVVIPGASSVAQAEENAAAADIELTDAEFDELGAASESYNPTRGLASLGAVLRVRSQRFIERLRRTGDALSA